MSEVYARVRRVYNPEPAEMEALFKDLPRDVNENMSFADIQQAVEADHDKRVARSRMLFPDLDPRTRKIIPKIAPVGVQADAAAKIRIPKDEEAMLSQYVYQMAEAEETKYPGLRQNVHLTRACMTSMDTVLSTKKRWDSECCVRNKDTAWAKQSKIVL